MAIPAFWAGAAGLLLLALNTSQIHKQHGWLLLGLAGLSLLGVAINYGDGAEMARIKGAVQLLYSIVIAYGLFLELKGWGRERVAKLFWVISLLLVAGCALELFTVFKDWSDSFRNHVFEPGRCTTAISGISWCLARSGQNYLPLNRLTWRSFSCCR